MKVLTECIVVIFCRRLVIYPNGNTKRGGRRHISLYLALDSLPPGREVYATYKLFVYDYNKDKYLTIQGACMCMFINN